MGWGGNQNLSGGTLAEFPGMHESAAYGWSCQSVALSVLGTEALKQQGKRGVCATCPLRTSCHTFHLGARLPGTHFLSTLALHSHHFSFLSLGIGYVHGDSKTLPSYSSFLS